MISGPMRISVSSDTDLEADLAVPDDPIGLVLFAHGNGSSRLSPRNRAVADALTERRLATFLMDLLDPGRGTAGVDRWRPPVRCGPPRWTPPGPRQNAAGSSSTVSMSATSVPVPAPQPH
jgi:hypothetical protein